ncbi:MAG: MFS transporter [Burkholderiales bacterium]|nr:MFS transporter [Burkholderiales bacterium]
MTDNLVDSGYAWYRLAVGLTLSTIGGVGSWAMVVVLPAVQAEFGVARADASLPYTVTLTFFALGSIVWGKLSDRAGIRVPVTLGALSLAIGYAGAAWSGGIGLYTVFHVFVGFGTAATFAPLLAHMSLWFEKRRGMAVGILASGNYFAGAIWPLVIAHFMASDGWRATFYGIAVFVLVTMLPLSLLLRRPPPHVDAAASAARVAGTPAALGLSPSALQTLLVIAGVACCVAMSMPQVHLVAYCGDLGYGPARGAQMLSLMLAFGIVSRLAFGVICDRIGGLRTLLIGSALQGLSLLLFLPFDGLVSLFVISALFGLFQGGIVPSYAIIIREYFPAREAGVRVGTVITASLFGMALGGWMSGAIFDLTGSYQAAFVNGILWNLANVSIALWLLRRSQAGPVKRMGGGDAGITQARG